MMWDVLMEIILALTLCKVQFEFTIQLCQSCFWITNLNNMFACLRVRA